MVAAVVIMPRIEDSLTQHINKQSRDRDQAQSCCFVNLEGIVPKVKFFCRDSHDAALTLGCTPLSAPQRCL